MRRRGRRGRLASRRCRATAARAPSTFSRVTASRSSFLVGLLLFPPLLVLLCFCLCFSTVAAGLGYHFDFMSKVSYA